MASLLFTPPGIFTVLSACSLSTYFTKHYVRSDMEMSYLKSSTSILSTFCVLIGCFISMVYSANKFSPNAQGTVMLSILLIMSLCVFFWIAFY